jgi:hypothetical protein
MIMQVALLVLFSAVTASAFTFMAGCQGDQGQHCHPFLRLQRSKTPTVLFVTRDEYLQPHFEAPPSAIDMDRIVYCAESNGMCSVSEMIRMIEGTIV